MGWAQTATPAQLKGLRLNGVNPPQQTPIIQGHFPPVAKTCWCAKWTPQAVQPAFDQSPIMEELTDQFAKQNENNETA